MERARQIVQGFGNLDTRNMYLFRHEYSSPTLLYPITSANQIVSF